MGKKADFYAACVRRAWRGSIDLANAWGPILGAAIIWILLALRNQESKMPDTIPGTVGFALMCLVAAWMAIFVFRIIDSAGQLFVAQGAELVAVQDQLVPMLKCSFGRDIPGCVRPITTLRLAAFDSNSGRPTGQAAAVTGTYYRIRVETTGIGSVQCTARIPWIKRNGRNWFDGENLIMPFAPAERPQCDIQEIRAGIPEYVDMIFLAHNQVLVTTKGFVFPSSVDFANMFRTPAEYLFHLVISSPTSVPVAHEIRLIWKGDHQTAEVIDMGSVSV